MALEHSPHVQDDSLTPADSSDPDAPSSAPAPEEAFEKGTQVNQYIVLERVGSGGQGVVYAAFDPLLDRKVALKLLHVGAQGGGELLLREARSLGRLSHPNVVAVHNVEFFKGRGFIAMKFMSGGTLGAWAKSPRTLDEVLARFREAGQGLAAAHAVNVVHRDFKPDNVLLDERGVASVTDFGLARDPQHTSAGGAGTRRYMAPEQRELGAVSPAADQYSFCVALFYVLTRGAFPVEDGGPPTPKFPPGDTTPQWVRAIITRGLSVDPSQRYPSMEALLHDLSADPRSQRRRLLRAAGAVTLVAGLAASAGAFIFTESPTQRAQRECVERVERTHERFWSGPRVQEMQERFTSAAGGLGTQTFERVRARMEPEAQAWARESTAACRLTDRAQRQVLTRCLETRGQTLLSLSNLFAHADRKVVESAVHALGLEMQPVSSCHTTAASLPQLEDSEADGRLRPTLAQARVLWAAGRAAQAREAAQAVVAASEEAGALRVNALAQLLVGQLSAELGEVGAEDRLKVALAAADSVGDDEARALGWMALVGLYAHLAEFPSSLAAEAQAEAIVKRLGSPELLEAELYRQRGRRLVGQGDRENAEAAFAHTRSILMKHRPDDDALVMRAQNNYLITLSDPAATLEGLQAMLLVRERVLGPHHPETALTHYNLASALFTLERYEEAEREVRLALASQQSAGEPDPRRLGQEQVLLAQALHAQHKLLAAIEEQHAGVELLRKGGEPEESLKDELRFLLELLEEGARPPPEQQRVRDAIKQLED